MSSIPSLRPSSPVTSLSLYLCKSRCFVQDTLNEWRVNTLGSFTHVMRGSLYEELVLPTWHGSYGWKVTRWLGVQNKDFLLVGTLLPFMEEFKDVSYQGPFKYRHSVWNPSLTQNYGEGRSSRSTIMLGFGTPKECRNVVSRSDREFLSLDLCTWFCF